MDKAAAAQLAVDAATDGLTDDEAKFWEQAFLRVAPACVQAQGWKTAEGKSITNAQARMALAGLVADYAVQERRERFASK